MNLRYFLFWIPGIPIAIINGSIRQFFIMKYFSELTSHQISVLTFIILFSFYVWFILPYLKLTSAKSALSVGALWLFLTILFEFVFGHYVMGHSWDTLFHDYNLFDGRLWIVVLAWIFFANYILFMIRYKNAVEESK